jgi:hypothetical protein
MHLVLAVPTLVGILELEGLLLSIEQCIAGTQERPYKDDSTASRLLSEGKHLLARLVLDPTVGDHVGILGVVLLLLGTLECRLCTKQNVTRLVFFRALQYIECIINCNL